MVTDLNIVQLIILINVVTDKLNIRHKTAATFLDVQKTFDKV